MSNIDYSAFIIYGHYHNNTMSRYGGYACGIISTCRVTNDACKNFENNECDLHKWIAPPPYANEYTPSEISSVLFVRKGQTCIILLLIIKFYSFIYSSFHSTYVTSKKFTQTSRKCPHHLFS